MMGTYSKQEVNELFSKLEVGLFIIDKVTNEILFTDTKVAIDLELKNESIHGRVIQEVFTADFTKFYLSLCKGLESKTSNTGVYYWAERDMWEQVSVSHLSWNDREAILLSITNVDDIIRREYEYKQLAFYDAVTVCLMSVNSNKI